MMSGFMGLVEAVCSVALKLGASVESVREWVCRFEIDAGARAGVASVERERVLSLERENCELRGANEVSASALVGAGLDGQSRP